VKHALMYLININMEETEHFNIKGKIID